MTDLNRRKVLQTPKGASYINYIKLRRNVLYELVPQPHQTIKRSAADDNWIVTPRPKYYRQWHRIKSTLLILISAEKY